MTECDDNKTLIGQLVDKTMRHWEIVGKELAKKAGISETHLSQFRNGRTNIGDDKLVKLLSAMDEIAPGSRSYFCALLADSHDAQKHFFSQLLGDSADLKQLIASMDLIQLAELMDVIALRMRSQTKIGNFTVSSRSALPL